MLVALGGSLGSVIIALDFQMPFSEEEGMLQLHVGVEGILFGRYNGKLARTELAVTVKISIFHGEGLSR